MKARVKCLYKTKCSKTGEQLTAYLDGELCNEEQAQMELHLESCRSCREEYNSLRQTVSLLQQMPEVTSERIFRIDERDVVQKTGDRKLLILYRVTAGVAVILALVCIGDFMHLFTPAGDTSLGGYFWVVRVLEIGLLVVLITLIINIFVRLLKLRK